MLGKYDFMLIPIILLLPLHVKTFSTIFPPGYAPVNLRPASISIDLIRNVTPAVAPPVKETREVQGVAVLTNNGYSREGNTY